eukprot:CAMPEP_0198279922 /NCGR_PEP_ID=MMETSP1449-20131203/122_1 /TAXON_ID=420275 /ORGANISM="Attheya septentrionalis, Strain CCMP2084" /LENGTH=261 /DNA_ID=CAMNT_0043975167 /DNA_START=24 /DNA_END=809 /DNA_ORIENTATION=+
MVPLASRSARLLCTVWVLLSQCIITAEAFSAVRNSIATDRGSGLASTTLVAAKIARGDGDNVAANLMDRRGLFQTVLVSSMVATVGRAQKVNAIEALPLGSYLYTILRVREATEQETRLIGTGKFKDLQRANVKLAVRFMLQNYRLNDNLIAAAAFLSDQQKRAAAATVGQSAVQSLYTILEYFDSSDVQNLKVGGMGMSGKEQLVIKGLDSTRNYIDDFLVYFPRDEIEAAKAKIQEENALNIKEFDPTIGTILNPNPTK